MAERDREGGGDDNEAPEEVTKEEAFEAEQQLQASEHHAQRRRRQKAAAIRSDTLPDEVLRAAFSEQHHSHPPQSAHGEHTSRTSGEAGEEDGVELQEESELAEDDPVNEIGYRAGVSRSGAQIVRSQARGSLESLALPRKSAQSFATERLWKRRRRERSMLQRTNALQPAVSFNPSSKEQRR